MSASAFQPIRTTGPRARSFWLDSIKGVACLLIVAHHLAFYGPMSDVLHPHATVLIDGLYSHARMVVQVFLVLGGYLTAPLILNWGERNTAHVAGLLWRRYARLAVPLMVALTLCMLVTELVRPWFIHPSVPDEPTWAQLLAHVFMLQGLLGYDSLSAGVWYVAIDFQLYGSAIVLSWAVAAFGPVWHRVGWHSSSVVLMGVVLLTVASLFGFNLDARWDATALYFWGAYGLGVITWYAGRQGSVALWSAVLGGLAVMALGWAFRERIALAFASCFFLLWVVAPAERRMTRSAEPTQLPVWLAWSTRLGQMSYSVFVIHFPVCLVVNAVVAHTWPGLVWAHALGLVFAMLASVGAGGLLYETIERRQAGWRYPAWSLSTLVSAGAMVMPWA